MNDNRADCLTTTKNAQRRLPEIDRFLDVNFLFFFKDTGETYKNFCLYFIIRSGTTGGPSVAMGNMLAFTTLLARRLLLLKWKDQFPSTLSHWIKEVTQHLKLGKMCYSVRGSAITFIISSKPFLSFVEDMGPDNFITT
jgi:hypothetical protein